MKEFDHIPEAKKVEITSVEHLGTLAKRVYRAGIKLASEANRNKSKAKGSIPNDRGLIIESDERDFIKRSFEEKGWIINIKSKRTLPNDIQMTDGQSLVEISVKKIKDNK